jgi:hypothetical protein
MLNADGKPRYWLGAYDAWHLVIPAALLVVVALLVIWPIPAPRPKPAPPVAMIPTAWISPAPGSIIPVGRFGLIEGQGQPGGRLTLWLRQLPNPERVLVERPVGGDGRFSIALTNFPPGSYGFRAEVTAPDGRRSSSFEVPVNLVPNPPAPKPSPSKVPARKAPARRAVRH